MSHLADTCIWVHITFLIIDAFLIIEVIAALVAPAKN